MTILEAMEHPELFGPFFQPRESWVAWRAFLAALFGLPLEGDALDIYRQQTGRTTAPAGAHREAWVASGRRSGKSYIAALVATYLAAFRDYSNVLAPGERATIMVIAADRKQARTVLRYIGGFFDNVPALALKILARGKESIELSNRVSIEVHTASFRATRGYTIAAAILDEVAFWPTDDSAEPDTEIVAAIRPGMVTVPGALLLGISSPYARRGILWDVYEKHYGKDDAPVLVWKAPTRSMNPGVSEADIAAAYAADEASATAEYGAEFRKDVDGFVSREVVDGAVVPGRRELPPIAGQEYFGFVDPAGGSGQDSMSIAIGHTEARGETDVVVLDALRERKPPFSPTQVVDEWCEFLAAYGVRRIVGDRFGGEWCREPFRAKGIGYELADKAKSDLYGELLPALNSGRVELLDHDRLRTQLLGLERRTSRGGRDSIDHGPAGHDDVSNVLAGVAYECLRRGGYADPFSGMSASVRPPPEVRARLRAQWLAERARRAAEPAAAPQP